LGATKGERRVVYPADGSRVLGNLTEDWEDSASPKKGGRTSDGRVGGPKGESKGR